MVEGYFQSKPKYSCADVKLCEDKDHLSSSLFCSLGGQNAVNILEVVFLSIFEMKYFRANITLMVILKASL